MKIEIILIILMWGGMLYILFKVLSLIIPEIKRIRIHPRFEVDFSNWDGGRFEKFKYWRQIKNSIRKNWDNYLFIDVKDLKTGKKKRFKDNPKEIKPNPVIINPPQGGSGVPPKPAVKIEFGSGERVNYSTCLVDHPSFSTGDYYIGHPSSGDEIERLRKKYLDLIEKEEKGKTRSTGSK